MSLLAFVEEEILEEPSQVPPKSLLFTILDNWQPPNQIPTSISAPTTILQEQEVREETTCIIEEEFLHLDIEDTIQIKYSGMAEDLDAVKNLGETKDMEESHKEFNEAATVCSLEVEGEKILAPPPLFTLLDFSQEPPPFFHPKKLVLAFQLRSHMANQIH